MSIISFLMFSVTGIQYWLDNYFEKVLGVDKTTSTYSVAFICFTAPISGVIFGGSIMSYFGGY
jgi:hypothetical protein